MTLHQAYIGIGSNIGDRMAHLRDAVQLLNVLPGTSITGISRIYMTEPVGDPDQERFYNGVLSVSTKLEPETLRRHCKEIEHRLGRPLAYQKWSPRVIDLDILLCDALVIDTPALKLPHPELHKRKFVLIPLLDLANPVHPILGNNALALLKACTDRSVPVRIREKLVI